MLLQFKRHVPLAAAALLYCAGMVAVFHWSSDWTARQTWAVVLTGLAIIWYTWETNLLRQATLSHRELQLRPFVVLGPRTEGGFYAHNVGYGPALNVRIDDVTISDTENVVVRFPDPVCIIEAGKSANVRAESFKRGKSAGDFFLAHLDPQYTKHDFRIRIIFQNAEMQTYFVVESVSPKALGIVEVSSREAL